MVATIGNKDCTIDVHIDTPWRAQFISCVTSTIATGRLKRQRELSFLEIVKELELSYENTSCSVATSPESDSVVRLFTEIQILLSVDENAVRGTDTIER